MRDGMPRLARLHGEAGRDDVQRAQRDGDREPGRGLDAHGELLTETIVRDGPSMTRSTPNRPETLLPERSPS